MAVLITGASAGFGRAMCESFVKAGFQVIGAARRFEKLQAMREHLGDAFLPLEMDLADKASIDAALASLPPDFADIDCLINNGGLALGLEPAQQADFDDWHTMIQTNIIGLTYLTRQVLPGMVARQDGYIINIGSIAGTYPYPGGNVYGATKAFVRQFSLNLRADLHGTGVRVSNIEPGLCGGTEFSHIRFKGDGEKAAKVYEHADYLTAQDIADTALWLYQSPKRFNINSLEVMPTAQSFGALPVHRPVPTTEAAAAEPVKSGPEPASSGGLFAWLRGKL